MLRSEASSWPPIKNNWSNGLEEYFFFLVTGAKNVITGEWPPQCNIVLRSQDNVVLCGRARPRLAAE